MLQLRLHRRRLSNIKTANHRKTRLRWSCKGMSMKLLPKIFLGVSIIVLTGAILAFGFSNNWFVRERRAQEHAVPSTPFRIIAEDAVCTKRAGFASSCAENGLRLLRVTDLSLASGGAKLSLIATMPQGAASVISPRAYYWSAAGRQWKPFLLNGTLYAAQSVWLKNEAWAALTIPYGDLAPGPNHLIVWDYLFQSGAWIGPRCVVSAVKQPQRVESCWRVVSFMLAR